jgi:hypothetical protein
MEVILVACINQNFTVKKLGQSLQEQIGQEQEPSRLMV